MSSDSFTEQAQPDTTRYVSREDIRDLMQARNGRASLMLAMNWLSIILTFAVPILWTNPFTIVLAILFLGGRMLGLGVLNHECAHRSFFSSPAANDFVGQWLTGAPLNVSVYAYRKVHMRHHRFAGSPDDPDQVFVKDYPITQARLRRKLWRDVSGQTGWRDLKFQMSRFSWQRNHPWVIFHVVLLSLLTLVGAPWAYAMWWAAELFVYPAILRIRQIGEHGIAADRNNTDVRMHTGTTLVSWWQRWLLAPNYVNYHVEHHRYAGVPNYNLPRLHKLLAQAGYFEDHSCLTHGYSGVLRRAVAVA